MTRKNRPLRTLLAAILFAGPTAPELARAASFYVDGLHGNDANDCLAPGTPCKTITNALALANAASSPPHTVHVSSGLYDDNFNGETFPLTPGDGVSLVSDAGVAQATVAINNAANANPVIRYASNLTLSTSTVLQGFWLFNAANGQVVVAITPTNPGDAISPVISSNVVDQTNNTTADAVFINPAAATTASPLVSGNTFYAPAVGVHFVGAGLSQAVISGNSVLGSATAVKFEPNASGANFSPLISSNRLNQMGQEGIQISNVGAGMTVSPAISNNTISGSAGAGIYITYDAGTVSPVIVNNTITTSAQDGIRLYGASDLVSSATISGNVIAGNSGNGIYELDYGAGGVSPTIANNTVSGSGSLGMELYAYGSSTLAVASNTVTGSANDGIDIFSSNNASTLVAANSVSGSTNFGLNLFGNSVLPSTVTANSTSGNAGGGISLANFGNVPWPVANNFFAGDGSNEVTITGASPVLSSNTILASVNQNAVLVSGGSAPDLGGGALGSLGHNTILGAGSGKDLVNSGPALSANYNWWTDTSTVHITFGAGVTVNPFDNNPLTFSVSPPLGPLAGGTAVTLTASATSFFVDNVGSTSTRISVKIGGAPAANVQVNAAGTRLTAVAPAGAAGLQDVTVTNPFGRQNGTLSKGFFYGVFPPPPGPPANLTATALGISSITWTWTASTGVVQSYNVYAATSPSTLLANLQATTFTYTGLGTNTTFSILVAGVSFAGQSADAGPAQAATLALPPSGSSVAVVGAFPQVFATSATINWAAAGGNPAFTPVQVDRSSASAFNLVVSSVAGVVTSYTDQNLLGCSTYFFRVGYNNLDGKSSFDPGTTNAPFLTFVTSNTVPTPPFGLTAVPKAGSKIALGWSPSPTEGITQYQLYWDSGTGVVPSTGLAAGTSLAPHLFAVFSSTVNSYTTPVLNSTGTYIFRLTATHRCGVEEAVGATAEAPAAPVLAAVSADIGAPQAGALINGGAAGSNAVALAANLTAGLPSAVQQVVFQFQAVGSSSWTVISTAAAIPFAVTWDPSPTGFNLSNTNASCPTSANPAAIGGCLYNLRAVAYDLNGTSDTFPSSIQAALIPTQDPSTLGALSVSALTSLIGFESDTTGANASVGITNPAAVVETKVISDGTAQSMTTTGSGNLGTVSIGAGAFGNGPAVVTFSANPLSASDANTASVGLGYKPLIVPMGSNMPPAPLVVSLSASGPNNPGCTLAGCNLGNGANATIKIQYPDKNNTGTIDGTNPPLRADQVKFLSSRATPKRGPTLRA